MNSLEIQKEIYNKLSALNYKVYDYVPKDAPMPHVRLGHMSLSDYSDKTHKGESILQYIDIFSDYKGQAQTKEIAAKVNKTLLETPLKIDGLDIDIKLKTFNVLQEDEKAQTISGSVPSTIFHGVLIYKILIKELTK